jgi:hypothetical protein
VVVAVVEYVPTRVPERTALVNEVVLNHPAVTFFHEYVVVLEIAPST